MYIHICIYIHIYTNIYIYIQYIYTIYTNILYQFCMSRKKCQIIYSKQDITFSVRVVFRFLPNL